MADTTSQPPRSRPTLRSWIARCWPLLAALLILAVYAALVIKGLDFYTWHDDEPIFTLTSRAVYEGHALYREVWFNYPPGFIQYLALFYRLTGFLADRRARGRVCGRAADGGRGGADRPASLGAQE